MADDRNGRLGKVRSKVVHTASGLKETLFPTCPDLLRSILIGSSWIHMNWRILLSPFLSKPKISKECPVLVSAGIELIFFLVAGTVLCFWI